MVHLARSVLGAPYGLAAALRSWAYARGLLAVNRVPAPVVAVGNLSVGGTGKTPLVVALVERLRAAGFRPGVLARGYGRAAGAALNDEGRLLARRFPDLPQVQRPDRVAGARELLAGGEADLVLLDDAFQHRRLHRDLDLVCLDCSRPWYRDHPLPAGRLREWPGALRRADLLVLTRAGGLEAEARERLVERARRDSGGRPVVVTEHAPRDVLDPEGDPRPPSILAGRKVVLAAGIGAPAAFLGTVEALGARVVGKRWFGDHARWSRADLEGLERLRESRGAELILLTEKDLARGDGFPFPVHALRIDLRILGGEEHLERSLAALGEAR